MTALLKKKKQTKKRDKHIRNTVVKSSAGRSELPQSMEIKLETEGTDTNEIGKKGRYRKAANLLQGADLGTGGHDKRGGDIPGASAAQPQHPGNCLRTGRKGYTFPLTLILVSRDRMRGV